MIRTSKDPVLGGAAFPMIVISFFKDEIIFCGFHLNQCVERDAKILKNLGHNIHIVVNMCSVLVKDMSQDFFPYV